MQKTIDKSIKSKAKSANVDLAKSASKQLNQKPNKDLISIQVLLNGVQCILMADYSSVLDDIPYQNKLDQGLALNEDETFIQMECEKSAFVSESVRQKFRQIFASYILEQLENAPQNNNEAKMVWAIISFIKTHMPNKTYQNLKPKKLRYCMEKEGGHTVNVDFILDRVNPKDLLAT